MMLLVVAPNMMIPVSGLPITDQPADIGANPVALNAIACRGATVAAYDDTCSQITGDQVSCPGLATADEVATGTIEVNTILAIAQRRSSRRVSTDAITEYVVTAAQFDLNSVAIGAAIAADNITSTVAVPPIMLFVAPLAM